MGGGFEGYIFWRSLGGQVGMEKLEGVSLGAVGYMLRDCAWREVQKA